MNSNIKIITAFIVGGALGAIVTNKLVKTKYNQIAQEEIDSVKEVFAAKQKILENNVNNIVDAKQQVARAKEKPPLDECVKIINKEKYTDYSRTSIKPKLDDRDNRDDPDTVILPYVISPNEFAEQAGYDTTSLNLFADGVVADDDDRVVEDYKTMIGSDALDHFGEYEDDTVFVRNDMLKMDFEVCKDQRNYSDVANKRPHDIS